LEKRPMFYIDLLFEILVFVITGLLAIPLSQLQG
jgi:hypothetical protein